MFETYSLSWIFDMTDLQQKLSESSLWNILHFASHFAVGKYSLQRKYNCKYIFIL